MTGTQDYFIVGHEEHVWNLFNRVAVGEGNPIFAAGMESVVSMTSSANDQVIYYDHWEDGCEADIRNPTQGTTLGFGDNNPANGDIRDYSSDPRLTSDQILLGTNIELTSEASAGPPLEQFVPMPRNSADLRFDGGDLVHATGGPLSVLHAQEPINTTFIGGTTEILSREGLGDAFAYSIPIGTDTYTRHGGNNTPGEPFKYVDLDLIALEDGTDIVIDNGTDPTVNITLNRGQSYSTAGEIDGAPAPGVAVLEGTRILTNGPLSGLLFTGGPGSYQTRFYAILPDRMHGKDILSITPGDVGANRPQNLYIFNPNDFNIDVTATDSLGSNTFTIAPGASVAYSEPAVMNRVVPGNSTARLLSSHNFWGLTARECNGTGADWGHSWIVSRFLSD